MLFRFLKNKKGGEQLMSIWWFAALIVVGTAIVIGVLSYYSSSVDVRELESQILYNKIADCLIRDGFLIDDIITKQDSFDIFTKCNLDEFIFSENQQFWKNFYFSINITDEQGNKIAKSLTYGPPEFYKQCEVQLKGKEKIEAENYPQCVWKTTLFLYKVNGIVTLGKMEVITASNHHGEKISIVGGAK